MVKEITEKQLKAAELLNEALEGDRRAKDLLAEGISTSDLPVQLTPALERIALNEYAATPSVWRDYAAVETVPSFESSPYYSFQWSDEDIPSTNGGKAFVSGALPHVPEYDEYPVLRFASTEQNLKTSKNGVQLKVSWETLVQTRNFGILRRTLTEFGRRAKNTEDVEAAKVLLPGAGNFTSTQLSGNPALSIPALEAAFQAIANQTYNGNPVVVPSGYKLVVGPALELTAAQIQAVTSIEKIETSGSTETRTVTGNPVGSKFSVVVNPWLPVLGAPANAWWLVPNPGSTPNPSVVNVFLEGETGPKVFVKRTTNSAPEEGDFTDDSYSTKVRHVVQGGFIRPEATAYSNGSGS